MAVPAPCLSVLIPVYNESATVLEILRRVAGNPLVAEIVVVDDASTDGTREKLAAVKADPASIRLPAAMRWTLILHDRNRGKGAALRSAIPRATGPISVIQDADLEYDPEDYAALARPILADEADVVFGSRYIGRARRGGLAANAAANRLLTFASNLATGLSLSDVETCLKAFRSKLLKSLPLRCEGFEFDPEVTAWVSRRRARVREVPVGYHARDHAQGKKIRWWDAVIAGLTIARFSRVARALLRR